MIWNLVLNLIQGNSDHVHYSSRSPDTVTNSKLRIQIFNRVDQTCYISTYLFVCLMLWQKKSASSDKRFNFT